MKKVDQDISKKILLAYPLISRKRGRLRIRWMDEMVEDTRIFG